MAASSTLTVIGVNGATLHRGNGRVDERDTNQVMSKERVSSGLNPDRPAARPSGVLMGAVADFIVTEPERVSVGNAQR